MTTPEESLFAAWTDAMAETLPQLDPRVRQRVLAAHAKCAQPSVFPLVYRWALGGLAVVATLVVLHFSRGPQTPSFQVAGHPAEVGAWLTAGPGHPLALRFSDGTQVALDPSSRARVAAVTGGGARIELAKGRFDAEVNHLPGANWTFGAGPFEVTVTGTHLDGSWSPESGKFELSVSRGSVLLRGPLIQGSQELRAGQVCRVDLTRRLIELGRTGAEPQASSTPAAPASEAHTPIVSEPEPSAPATNGSAPSLRPPSAEAWLEAARAARLAGHRDEERAALLACRRRAPGQPAAAQAAYLLGRASAAAEAAQWFEAYLREQPQGLLAREAAGRLIESYRASGNSNAAKAAAARYLGRYPHGPHASLAYQALGRAESRD